MTKLTTHSDQGDRTTPAPPPLAPGRRRPLAVLADPWVRLGAGTAVMLLTARAARRDRISPAEAAVFRAVNGFPDSIHLPAWAIMQLGTLGAAPSAAGIAWLTGERQLAARLLSAGTGTWALSKLVKQMVRRPRPASLLPGTHRRGPDAAGLGYLSGHAGVAVALGAAAMPHLGPAGRALTLTAIPAVGLTRVYVGAHLPLDILGGAALGLAVDAAITLTQRREPPPFARKSHFKSQRRPASGGNNRPQRRVPGARTTGNCAASAGGRAQIVPFGASGFAHAKPGCFGLGLGAGAKRSRPGSSGGPSRVSQRSWLSPVSVIRETISALFCC
jgi:membrane-associated phospholipid phosphatase